MHSEAASRRLLSPAGVALISAVLMMAQQIAGKATRDALFLSHFDVIELPKAMISAAILSFAAVIGVSRWIVRYGPARVVPTGFTLSATLFLIEWRLLDSHPGVAAVILYLHVSSFGAILISGFWSVLNERFDPYTARTTFGNVAAAAALGGIAGGGLAHWGAELTELSSVLLMLCAINALCALSVLFVGGGDRQQDAMLPRIDSAQARLGMKLFRDSPYLRLMVVLMTITAVVSTLLDYILKAEAAVHYTSAEDLVGFFSLLYGGIALVTFLLQSTLGLRILKRAGVGLTIAVQPVAVILTGLLAIGVPRLWTVILVRASETVLSNSLFRSGFELLYTPLPPWQRRPSKTFIDVGSQRFGDILGSGLVIALLALIPGLPNQLIVLVVVAAAIVALLLVRHLHRLYVEQLGHNLRSGVITLIEDEVVDATTKQAISDTQIEIDRGTLLHQIQRLHDSQRTMRDALYGTAATGREDVPHEEDIIPPDGYEQDAIVAATIALTSGELQQMRPVLSARPLDLRLIPLVIPLVGQPEIRRHAIRALRHVAPRIVGQMVDAFIDPETPLAVCRRLPSLLATTGSQRAVEGLMLGLQHPRFEIRYRCGQALRQILNGDNRMQVNRNMLCDIALNELATDARTWKEQSRQVEDIRPLYTVKDPAQRVEIDRSLEHVLTLLSLTYDRRILPLTLHALGSNDISLRGTALEYLENVIPESIRVRLWPHLNTIRPVRRYTSR
jgi:AAA family ATP:ADP antiporter